MLLDSPDEPRKVKSKKHKKHKKSKKETITLDEFLNMNKDVFGDGLNVQGIEEVPTQMVLKRKYITKKSENNETKAVKHDLAKLKKQGIVIKSNSSKVIPSPSTSDIVVQKKESNNENLIPTKISPTPIDPNDVISKLSQGNSQIKIVKTSAQHNPETKQESYQSSKIDSSSDYDTNKMTRTLEENKEFSENEENESDDPITKENFNIKYTKPEGEKEIENNKKEIKISSEQSDNFSNGDENTWVSKTQEDNLSIKAFQNIGTGVTIKSLSQISCEKQDAIDTLKQIENNEDDNIEDDHHEDVNEKEETMDSENNKKTNSMQSLNLNKSITIKPVFKKNVPSPVPQLKDQEYESYENISPSKPLSSLKSLNKQITIKPSSLSPSSNNHHTSDEEENEDYKIINDDDYVSQHSENDSKISKRTETPSKQENIIQTNADILKRLTNVTAKPVQPKRLSTKVSLKTVNNISKTLKKDLIKSTMENDVEILHIEDSDSDADTHHSHNQNFGNETQNSVGIKSKLSNNLPPTALCGLGKNVTIKSTSQQNTELTEVQTKDGQKECRKTNVSRKFESKNVNITNSKIVTEEQKSLQKTINNLRNITIKTKNSTPLNFKEEHSQSEDDDEYNEIFDPPLEDEEYHSDTSTGKVRITEMNEDETSDNKNSENQSDSKVNVESPSQSFLKDVSEKDEDDTFDEYDIESELKANAIKKINQPKQSFEHQKPINMPNINKEITIKPPRKKPVTEDDVHPQSEEPYDNSRDTQTMKDKTVNQQQMNKGIVQSSDKASSNQVSTVKSVKRYQSQTVIEEVTTTVTKTIRTVNTQEVKSASQTASRTIRPQRIMQIPKNPNLSAISRQAPLAGNKVKNCGPQIRPTVAKPTNMIVPTRPRLANPQMVSPFIIRKPSPVQSRPRAPNICHRPLRLLPPAAKRAAKESGHFSCFKKPKESLFPAEDTATKDGDNVQFSSTQSKSTFSNVTQIQKGGVSQMRSETSTSSQQHLAKLSGVSGLKIVKTSSKQATHVEEKCEMSAPKNSAMVALEKLQKQGLLIKKPRLETTMSKYHSQSENEEYEGEEN